MSLHTTSSQEAAALYDPLHMDLTYSTLALLAYLDTLGQQGSPTSSIAASALSAAQRQLLERFANPQEQLTLPEINLSLTTISTLLKNEHLCLKVLELYRPLVLDLIARWLVPDHGDSVPSSPDNQAMETDEPIINATGTPLDLENMAVALSIMLPIVPQATTYDLHRGYFILCLLGIRFTPPDTTLKAHRILITVFRLLSFSHNTFSPLWDWTPLYTLLNYNDNGIKYLTLRCLAMVLDIRDDQLDTALKAHLPHGVDVEIMTGNSTFKADLLSLVEQDRISAAQLALFRNPGSSNSTSQYRQINSSQLSPLTVNLCGVLLARPDNHGGKLSPHQLVLTETTKHNLHSIGLALSIGAPVLLEGVTGAGKTALVEEVARITGRDDLVKIHLGDQTDSKVLLGTYVSTSTPGSFRWQAGVLTTAVREGRWLLIEDIDLAPMEVLSVLLPLLESRTLFIPSRGEKIPAKEGFQLFATKSMIPTRSGRMVSRSVGGTDASIGSNLWTRVQVNSLSHSELSEIIHRRFHNLDNSILPELIMTVFENLVAIFASQDFSHSQSMVSRVISPRDLMKWCTRIDMLIEVKGGYEALSYMISRERGIDEMILQDLFSEAVDCFCSMIAEYEVWKEVLIRLGRALTLSSEKINWYIDNYTPKIDVRDLDLTIGRVTLPVLNGGQEMALRRSKRNPFAMTAHAKRLLEKIAVSVHLNEPVLLVGETGTGKTTVVQYLAHLLHHELTVINLSQQSDSSDLLGGFKPVDVKVLAVPLKDKFESLFPRTFAAKRNKEFLDRVHKMYSKGHWGKLIDVWTETVGKAEVMLNKPPKDTNQSGSKRVSPKLRQEWQEFAAKVAELKVTHSTAAAKFVFSFMEGSLVQAVRRGDWILLDEINLATTETLECLSGLLQDAQGSLLLAERGDSEPVPRHPNFRVFACMNPATDVGKKDLPPGLRNRFTEFYVHPPDARPDDLQEIVKGYLKDVVSHSEQGAFADIVEFYLEVKGKSNRHELADGAGQRPHFSMRTLTRALQFVREIVVTYGLRRAIYEAFSMTFLTQLNKDSERAVRALVEKHLLKGVKNPRALITQTPRRPTTEESLLQFDHYWLKCGRYTPVDVGQYILTPSVRTNLNNLARVVMTQRFPILIQGPTSAGKTSMIEYLANRLGHKFVRINNHEHTDLQEYLGTYISNSEGQLVFQEGVLVEALRNGWWIVLDELNLAPSDVLEALNRLLDDNRELLIPETGDIVRPHPDFMLFATQNPAGLYGGRKQLSRAFRNRFLELFFDDIPQDELAEILSKRCSLPDSRSVLLVEVYKGLMRRRQTTRIFEQGHGFITLRDLFRWAGRGSIDKTELAMDGYMILAERCRKEEEREVVQEVLEEIFKCKLDIDGMYESAEVQDYIQRFHGGRENVVWTRAMKRLFTLVSRCLKFKEPVLLVGETGCGKTTVCQMLAEYLNQELVIVNCHQNTETADLLGGQRPVRNKQGAVEQTKRDLVAFLQKVGGEIDFIPDEADLNVVIQSFENCVKAGQLEQQGSDELKAAILQLRQQYRQASTLFEWHDGPLVQSLKEGHLFLLDEISLADDSVLERLNSVLEPHRLLVLAEKGGKTVEVMYGVEKFQFLATMNPGGDYGKKELSPALRNRFTEVWVPAVTDRQDLIKIIEEQIKFPKEMAGFAARILDFVAWYADELGKSRVVVSLRDILAWVRFMNELVSKGGLSAEQAFVHGGSLVLLDGLGSNASAGGASLSGDLLREFRLRSLAVLSGREKIADGEDVFSEGTGLVKNEETTFGIQPFFIPKGSIKDQKIKFTLLAPTTTNNAMRVLRALQLRKPILLEGSPGVGKTSLISALATASGHPLVRINLSEQTDLMDLFGSDLPVEGGNSGEFAWRDAPFLQAMQSGDWVLLDEINLASQSVLEGLNSCLDHRGAVYIPELDKEFFCHKDFRVFAAQNPLQQGGGRKGLPKSFVNRFTQVFVEQLSDGDILFICKHLFPQVEDGTLRKMIDFNYQMYEETMVNHTFGRKGSPWEFNLRDVFRWMELMTLPDHGLGYTHDPAEHLDLIYLQRMRTEEDRQATIQLFEKVFRQPYERKMTPFYHIDTRHLQVGHSLLPRRHADTSDVLGKDLHLLQSFMKPMEGLMKCVEVNWMAILTGPSSSGKTSLVRLLANLTGNKLEEFSMNSGVDTMELLGGFEQVDLARHQEQVLLGLARLTSQVSRELVVMDNAEELKTLAYVREISQSLYLLNSQNKFSKRSSSALEVNKNNERMMRNNAIDGLLNQLRYLVQGFHFVDYAQDVTELEKKFALLKNLEQSSVSGRFEWIDGSLINALEHGYWLLIDNANLANPSVLDRLNSLMEPNGTLMVNERGLVDGEVKIIRPHKNFRIFMTVDPKYGELSRAMRNRGVEITLVDAEWIDNAQDVVKISNSLGIRGAGAPDLIRQVHHYLQLFFKATQPWKHLSAKDMLLFARFVAERLQRGEPLTQALRHCVRQVYSIEDTGVTTEFSDSGLPKDLELLPQEPPSFEFHSTIENSASPTNCPHLLDGRLLSNDSQLGMVSMHGSYLMYLLLTEAPVASIWTAAHYFLETCSSEDASLRTKWVDYLLATHAMEDATRSQTVMVQHILGQLVESPLMSHLTKLKGSLASQLSLNSSLLNSQPADMRMNPDLFWAIDQCCKENEAGAAIWVEYQASARLMALFIRVQKMDYHEQRVYAKARGKKPNTVQVSYLFNQQMWDKPLQHPVVAQISPCLNALKSISMQWISALKPLSQEQAELFHLFLDKRDMIWETVQEPVVNVGELMILVKMMGETVEALNRTLSDNYLGAFLQNLSAMTDAMVLTSGTLMKNLWRHLHPAVLATEELVELEQELLQVAYKADVWSDDALLDQGVLAKARALASMPDFKSTVVEAIATLYFADQSPEKVAALVKTIQQVPAHLQKKVDGVQQQLPGFPKITPATLQTAVDFMYPVMDFTSSVSEMTILAKLQQVLAGDVAMSPAVLEELHALYTFSLEKSTRSAADLVPHKRLIWAMELNKEGGEDSKAAMRRLAQEVAHSWYARLWQNAFKKTKFDSFSGKLPEESVVEIAAIEGPAKLFQSVTTMSYFNYLTTLPKAAVSTLDKQLEQTRVLTKHQSLSSNQLNRVASSLMNLIAAITMVLDVIVQVHADVDVSAQVSALNSVSRALLSGSRQSQYYEAALATLSQFPERLGSLKPVIASKHMHLSIQHLVHSIQMYQVIGDNEIKLQAEHGKAWIHLGLAFIGLYVPDYSLDPTAKPRLMLHALRHKQVQLQMEIQVRRDIEKTVTGADKNAVIEERLAELAKVEQAIENFATDVALRPAKTLLEEMFKQIWQIQKAAVNAESIQNLIASIESKNGAQYDQERLFQDITQEFIRRNTRKFQPYLDILQPLVVAVYQVKYGVRLVAAAYALDDQKDRDALESIVTCLVRVPDYHVSNSDRMDSVHVVTQPATLEVVRRTVFDNPRVAKKWSFYLKYLITALQHQRGAISSRGVMNMADIETLDLLFTEVQDIWAKGKEHAAQVAAENESLYKTRVKKHEGVDDDAIDEATFREMFPDFDEEFNTTEDNDQQEEEKKPSGVPEVEEKTFEDKDIILIGKLHRAVFEHLSSSQCSDRTVLTDQERRSRIWSWYSRASELADVSDCSFSHNVDTTAQGTHMLTSALMEEWLLGRDNHYWSSEPTYDFYKDQNVAEAGRIVPILEKLRIRLQDILSVWTEHAVLESLIQLCDKLLGFPMDSPVAKLLAGIEALLQKTEDWESVASREYSIKDNQSELTSLIVSWRQLELTCWPKLLETQDRNVAEEVFPWWFDYYGSILKPTREMDLAIDHGIKVDNVTTHIKDLLGVVDQFLQAATVGDFKPRMDLLKSFQRHLQIRGQLVMLGRQRRFKAGEIAKVEPSVSSQVADALWNVYLYYLQFMDKVESTVQMFKKPIEKDLKEHVKIATWKDINIHALKASALKTHRRLNKLLKKYRDVLRQPLTDIIQAYKLETPVVVAGKGKALDTVIQPSPKVWIADVRLDQQDKASEKLLTLADQQLQATGTTTEALLNLSKTFDRLKRFVSRDIVLPTTEDEPLDELCGDIIEQIEEFQKETPSKMTEENKSQLKNMKLIRKRALVDLLKLLQRLGLNRHRMVRLEEDLLGYVFHLPPAQIEDLQEQAKKSDKAIPAGKQVAQLWKKSDDYFYRIIARMIYLRELSHQPPKDITVVEAEKGRGYTEHLVHLVIEQRQELQSTKHQMDNLRGLAAQLESVFQLPSESTITLRSDAGDRLLQHKQSVDKLMDLASDAMLVFEVAVRQSAVALTTRSQVVKDVRDSLTRLRSLKASVDRLVSQWYLVPHVVGNVSPVLANATLDELQQGVRAVLDIEATLQQAVEQMPGTSFIWAPVLCQISEAFSTFGLDRLSLTQGGEEEQGLMASLAQNPALGQLLQDVQAEINGCVTTILVSIQETRSFMAKKRKEAEAATEETNGMDVTEDGHVTATAADADQEEEKDEYGMPEKYIITENKKFVALNKRLRLESIVNKTQSVNDKIQNLVQHFTNQYGAQSSQSRMSSQPMSSEQATAEALVTLALQRLYPFIHQWLFLAQHHLFHYVQHHKAITKLTYVLCNTFSILFSKGFCIPEMEQETKEGEEETNVAGTGIGDGDGGKDVSDEIEDEEQVLGLQNDKKQDDDQQKDTEEEDKGIEMENDFDGKLEDVKPTSDDENDDDDDEDEEEQEDPDEEIGDVDDDNPEAIDEKMWGDDEAEDARDNDKMIDEDQSTEQKEQESDMVAQDEEDQGKPDNKKDKKQKEQKDTADQKDNEGEEGGDEERPDQEPEEDEGAEEEEFEDHNDEENAEHNPESDQQNVEIPEAETLELPEDLNLDGDEDEKEDKQDEGPDEESFDDKMDVEEQPKSKDKKGEEEEDSEGEEEKEQEDDAKKDDQAEDSPMDGQEDEEDVEMEEPSLENEEEGEKEGEEEEKEDEDMRDDSRQRPMDDSRTHQEQVEEEKPEEEEEEEDVEASKQEEQPDNDAQTQQEFGVEGMEGKASAHDNAQDEADKQQSRQSAPSASKSDPKMDEQRMDQPQQRPQDRGEDSQKEAMSSMEQEQQEKPKKQEVNPHRSLAEALKNWRQKLQDVADPEEQEEEEPKADDAADQKEKEEQAKDETEKDGEAEEMEVDENQEFEYLQNDEEAHDMETMGNATEEQMKDNQQKQAAIDEEKMKDDDVADMDVDSKEEEESKDEGAEEDKPELKEDVMDETKPENAGGAFFSQRLNKDKNKKEEDEEDENADPEHRRKAKAEEQHEPLRPEEMERIRHELELELEGWGEKRKDAKEAQALWQKYDNLTQDLALGLCEQLRLILEPTLATKLKGDYRTGKRLNMKKIIPYIASQFKKDKIWLRRTKPSKRQYQVMIAIDDSTSMKESQSIQLAYESLALISKALSQLEVGEIGIMSFGERSRLVHGFDQPFTGDAGAKVLQQFGFDQVRTDVRQLMEASIAHLQQAKMNQSGGGGAHELWQLEIIISDGICDNHDVLKALVRQAADQQIMLIFIVLDNKPTKDSIMEMQKTSFRMVDGKFKLQLDRYLDTFPFDYYVVLQDIHSLPETLADALRQYFSFVAS
ncbi:AAA ATPase midasin [Actinomortierella ambigua]|nr:AAA ATPase midasin [Actinomortierella ambigua]